ncbi:MAG: sulfatase-like hydrolase/transferase [Thermoleophilaceae bacterium]
MASPTVPLPLRGLHLGVLYALAVSQPLLNLLGNNADFFTSRQLTSGKVFWFAVAVGLLIPIVLFALDVGVGLLNRGAGWIVHLVLVFGLTLLLMAQIVKKTAHMPSGVTIAVAAVLAAVVTLIYTRSAPLRSIASYFAPLPLLVLALFLFNTPAHKIVFPGSTASADVVAHGNTPVVMVVFDEFTGTSLLDSHNKIDPKLYPNFAQLAKDGTYYRNYTASADETTRVMAGLMTGDMWHEHAVPIAAEYPHNLFTLLGRSYRMRVGEEATDLCPVKLCHQRGASSSSVFSDAGLVYLHQISPRGIEKHLTPVNETLGKFTDAEATPADTQGTRTRRPKAGIDNARPHGKDVILGELGGGGRPARFEQWAEGIDGKVDRTLYFKHVLLPHVPWQYLPDGRVYRRHAQEYIPGVNSEPSFGDTWLLEQGYQRHLMQAAFSDRLVGRLIERLKQVGLYDKALIVITADNGESFLHRNHDRHIADPVTFTDIASTPLFIKRPREQNGGYDDRHVRTFDIVPTIADLTGVKVPWRIEGRSIFGGKIGSRVYVHREQMKKGEVFSISLAGYERARRKALTRKVALFGSDGRGPGLFGIGPNAGLIGRSVTDLQPRRATAFRGQLTPEVRKLLGNVDTGSTFLPANVTGRITGKGAGRGIPLALALNGKIAAVGWSAMLRGDRHVYFSFFAPPSAFRDGPNAAQVFVVSGSPAAPQLAQIA